MIDGGEGEGKQEDEGWGRNVKGVYGLGRFKNEPKTFNDDFATQDRI